MDYPQKNWFKNFFPDVHHWELYKSNNITTQIHSPKTPSLWGPRMRDQPNRSRLKNIDINETKEFCFLQKVLPCNILRWLLSGNIFLLLLRETFLSSDWQQITLHISRQHLAYISPTTGNHKHKNDELSVKFNVL